MWWICDTTEPGAETCCGWIPRSGTRPRWRYLCSWGWRAGGRGWPRRRRRCTSIGRASRWGILYGMDPGWRLWLRIYKRYTWRTVKRNIPWCIAVLDTSWLYLNALNGFSHLPVSTHTNMKVPSGTKNGSSEWCHRTVVPKLRPASTFGPAPWTIPETRSD